MLRIHRNVLRVLRISRGPWEGRPGLHRSDFNFSESTEPKKIKRNQRRKLIQTFIKLILEIKFDTAKIN